MMIWISSFSLGYDLLGQPRYLWMLIPVTSVVAIAGIERVYESLSSDVRRTFFTGITAGTTLFLFWPVLTGAYNVRHSEHEAPPAWAQWAAANLKGKIAIYDGVAYLMQLLPDASIAGVGDFDLYAPISGISVMRPGNLPGPESAWAYFESRGVSYVVVEPGVGGVRPYMLEIGDPRFRNRFEPVFTDATTSPPTVIFKVVVTK
jgi:hypothetical protein